MAITEGGDIPTILTIRTTLTIRLTRAIPMVRTIAGFPGMALFLMRPTRLRLAHIRRRIPKGAIRRQRPALTWRTANGTGSDLSRLLQYSLHHLKPCGIHGQASRFELTTPIWGTANGIASALSPLRQCAPHRLKPCGIHRQASRFAPTTLA
jgi:hypothetical protein